MTIRTKYVNGMNEIKADDEFKQTIINKASTSAAFPQTVARAFRSKFAMVSVSCMIIFLLAIGGPIFFHNEDKANPTTLFSGFVVTAYAADGAPLEVKPNVDFPLGQYSILMSSVPGFPIKITSQDADKIELRTSEGQVLLWNPSDSIVIPMGKKVTFNSGDTIYWSPLGEGDPIQVAGESILEVTAYKDLKQLGSSTIKINSEDDNMYKGKLLFD
jgi:hypothetical protein